MHRPHLPASSRRVAPALAASAVLLSACGQVAPGVAAEVGDDTITDQQVDDVAQVLCALNADPSGAAAPTASKTVRAQALQLLVANELAEDVVDPDSVDRRQLREALAQSAETREAVPSTLRPVFDDVVRDYVTAQLGLTELGRQALRRQGGSAGEVDDQAALAEGERLRTQHAAEVDIAVDPRFGTVTDGVLTPATGSLSVAVSETARSGAAENPDAGALPATQTCG